MPTWEEKVIEYCIKYNLPLAFLAETLNEPKVIPMIRGKSFEFSIYEKLKTILPPAIWEVYKPTMNAQFGAHDIDVGIRHIETNRHVSIECKLAAKGRFKIQNNNTIIGIKCMRSRTLGDKKITELAPIIGVPEAVLKVHNDQYVASDFNLVITSIGNAFFQTDDNGNFIFQPTLSQIEFLNNNFPNPATWQQDTFDAIYVARADKILVSPNNDVICTRKNCINKTDCNFIPNYPDIEFDGLSLNPINNWWQLSEIENLLLEYIEEI